MEQTMIALQVGVVPSGLSYQSIGPDRYAYSCRLDGSEEYLLPFGIPQAIKQQIREVLQSLPAVQLHEVWLGSETPAVLGYIMTNEDNTLVLQDWATGIVPVARKCLRQARIGLLPGLVDAERIDLTSTAFDFEVKDGTTRMITHKVTHVQFAALEAFWMFGDDSQALISVELVLSELEGCPAPLSCVERMVLEICKEAQCAGAKYSLVEMEE